MRRSDIRIEQTYRDRLVASGAQRRHEFLSDPIKVKSTLDAAIRPYTLADLMAGSTRPHRFR